MFKPDKPPKFYNPPPKKPHQPDPDKGKDLSYLVPDIKVAWSYLPSYNIPPSQGSGKPQKHVASVGYFRADLPAMRVAEAVMLGDAQIAVDVYENVRNYTLSHMDSIFGQNVKGRTVDVPNPEGGGAPNPQHEPNPFRENARTFGATMGPAMERALEQIGGVLETMGAYIALVNHSGQVYAAADRKSEFPRPGA